MPPLVQPDLAHARFAEEGLPGAPVRLALDRPTVGLGEDQVVVPPRRAGGHALLELCGPVSQGHGPAAAVRLRLLVDEALSADAHRDRTPMVNQPGGQVSSRHSPARAWVLEGAVAAGAGGPRAVEAGRPAKENSSGAHPALPSLMG